MKRCRISSSNRLSTRRCPAIRALVGIPGYCSFRKPSPCKSINSPAGILNKKSSSQAVLGCNFKESQAATLIALADRSLRTREFRICTSSLTMPLSSRRGSVRSGSSIESDRSRTRKPNPTCEDCDGKGWFRTSRQERVSVPCNVCWARGWVYCCQAPAIFCRYCRNGLPRRVDCGRCSGIGRIIVLRTHHTDHTCGCAY